MLRNIIETAAAENGGRLVDYTVLAPVRDPYRLDTPANHRDAQWFKDQLERLNLTHRRLHLRGLHYAFVSTSGLVKPNGLPYLNTEEDWTWLCEHPAKVARWLRYVPFTSIVDQRNEAPVIHRRAAETPSARITVGGFDIEVPPLERLRPEVEISGFAGRQRHHFAIFGEKTSLEDVLGPIARTFNADLYLPTGEISDTLLYQMAEDGAEDGRPMVVFVLADFDPAGHQMAVSIGHKLRALRDGFFPDLEFQVHPVALTRKQVQTYGLPSTPLKSSERRADRWRDAFGVEQTEIDALATLRPDVLRRIVRDAISPFYDFELDRRVRRAAEDYRTAAQAELDAHVDDSFLQHLRDQAAAALETIRPQLDAITGELDLYDGGGIEWPPFMVPGAELDGKPSPLPLVSSQMDFATAARRLIGRKAYQ